MRVSLTAGMVLAVLSLAACQTPAKPVPTFNTPLLWTTPLPSTTPIFFLPMITVAPTLAPTTTPRTHTVVSGDTLGTIASKYQIKLDALQAANPGVQERFLRIGQVLKIPSIVLPSVAPAMSTPVPIAIGPVRCYAQPDGAEWCLTMLTNPLTNKVGGVTVQFSLYANPNQAPVTGQTVDMPLRYLRAGDSIPVVAFFSAEGANGSFAIATISTAVISPADNLPSVYFENTEMKPIPGGMDITSDFRVDAGVKNPITRMDIVLTLLDSEGMPVGVRILRQPGAWSANDTGKVEMVGYALNGIAVSYSLSMEPVF